jgi:flagellar protein FlbD
MELSAGTCMVTVTRLDGVTIVLNAELIETIESVPDTIITLINDKKVVVEESVAQVVESVLNYQRTIRMPLRDRMTIR